MRFLIVLAALAVVAVVVVLLLYGFSDRSSRSRARLEGGARWEPHTESTGGVTAVVVRRVSRGAAGDVLAEIGRQTVATIPDADPEWEERYHEAMAQARSRVAALESEAD
ncbi:hypothetical protein [Actinomadura citrea]|uniref:Uncharacterized protein n=1 Tax=Actinomadura citrea TaxID=46158 RepID=A0A7Y9GIG3_9ACTN|nr:hypothetical protein [Actinomadura citrea]NYE17131.1 hypothetical protein [Actinomadura citrea]GGU09214.1 hypothetical protein GCM10010177_80320 [Actinomadura citrea]